MTDYATSLMSSFRRIPSSAIPATLECILASTTSPPPFLFSLLLDALPILLQEVTHGSEESLDDECCNFIASYVGALCHLMKKPGINVEALQNFVLRVLIPLMRLTQSYHRGIVDKVMDSFLDVVMETNAWGVLEETMIPYFIKSIYLTMGKLQNEEYTVYTSEDSTLTNVDSFPLLTSCHILASTLDASVKGKHVSESSSGSILANGCSVHMFTGNLLGDISNVTFQMLSHIPEHRSCAITVFLPHILKAFLLKNAFEISVRGQKFLFSRNDFFGKVWKCCKNLFLMGASERRDAYTVLSLYISYFSKSDGCEDDSVSGNGTFDLRAEKEFWDEMKKGLVDKESIVRKQSLHILKSTTTSNKEKKHSSVLETISNGTTSNPNSLTKRERWANKEARSLGIESLCNSIDSDSSSQLKWGAFFLLYEMLEEYGTHLVEAAWNYQMNLLLDTSRPSDNHSKPVNERLHLDPMETLEDMFDWLAVLWLRGLCHDNPQVRCLIMQSVFGIEWKNHGNYAKFVPRDFVLGSFIQGLNDPVHHKEFGLKGVYSSRTIDGASTFLQQYTMCLSEREQMKFLSDLATLVKNQSFGRAGLMSLAECVAAAAFGIGTHHKNEVDIDSTYYNDRAALLDVFRFIIESSKQHFNPNYRLKVCGKILDATISVMSSSDVALEPLLHFISSFPPDFVNYGGSLREKVRKWLRGYEKQDFKLVNKLNEFPGSFINHNHSENDIVTYDDEDMELWELKAKRWARALFLAIEEEHQLDSLLQFIQTHGNDLCNKSGYQKWLPVKYMILILSVVQELHEMKNKTVDNRAKRTNGLIEIVDHAGSMVIQKFTESFTFILKDLESYTKESCTVFWSKEVGDTTLPSSIKGRLGGLSQRRLSSSNTTAVLQAITSVKTLASISSYCAHFQEEESLSSTLDVLSDISWDIISHTSCNSETKAEIQLGAYEALHHILKSLVLMPSSSALSLLTKLYDFLSPEAVVKPHIGFFVQMYLDNINYLIETGYLARARRAILIEWKWLCLESLLSIPKNALQRGVPIKNCDYFFSDGVVRKIFNDLVDSLENASEGSVLPMLRSLRLVLDLFVLGCRGSTDSSCDSIDVQMMWHLVRSSWLLHVSCNKRRVAPIAALLSSVLHNSVFSNMDMHEFDNTPGPLKWEVTHGSEESLDDECCNFIASYVGALCHLMKKPGINVEALQNFVLRVLIPLMRLTQSYHRGIVDKVMDSFLDVVMETNAWGVLEETMIPYFIKSIYLTMGKLQNEEYTVYTSEDSTLTNVDSFPLLTSCHILASTLDASVKGKHVSESSSGSILANGCSVHMFTGNLLGDISNVTFQMLSHIPEHRSCAITVFLPHILKAFLLKNAFEISVRGQKFLFSRNDFFGKVWKCCKNLFLMGASERRDAYTVLSLYISYFSKSDGCEDDSVSGNGTFDLRAEKEFWDEMKKGLVDKESIVRKQSLHILKSTTTSNKEKKHSSVLETISNGTTSNPNSLTKRERWANKEARSLGIESLCNSIDSDSSSQLKWGAFFLLYEMLEEYGTHLVEAAWNYQMNLLLDTSRPSDNHSKPVNERLHLDPMETLEDMFDWLAVLWLRGLCHDNPQVRCLIMQSVFGIEWKNHGNYAKFVPRDFVLGSFIQGLNDPVHHKEFGLKGVYSSRTIDGASTFLQQYTMCLSEREQMKFLSDLATLVKNQSFGRAGLMSLAECVAAAAFGIGTHHKNEVDIDSTYYNDRAALLDVFRFIIESSKQHFNPNYRLKVCGKILDATISVMSSSDVALEPLLHFISSFPPDFVNYGGSLREKVRKWLRGYEKQDFKLVNKLNEFPGSFINHNHSENDIVTYDDEDMELWELKAKRWARALFLAIEEEHQLDSLLQFIQTHGNDLCNKSGYQKWLPVKYMILILSVVQELHEMKNKTVDNRAKRTNGLIEIVDHAGSMVIQKFTESFTFILKDLESYTKESCTVFWSKEVGDTTLPSSIKGRLGGLSQRRLSSSNTTAVLQAITSVKTLASISSYCAHFQEEESLSSTLDVLSDISWDIISHTSCNSETKAEIQLGAYEALHHILKSLVLMPSSSALSLLTKLYDFLSPEAVVKPHIGFFVQMYLDNINYLIETGYLARARRAILIEWKWLCLESLLSIPKNALQRGVPIKNCDYFFSDGVVRKIFNDLVDSLENASEGSVLPMLRSLRLVLDLFVLGCRGSTDSSCDSIDVQMMWHLVRSSWLLHVSCNKRRVAPIAALLSSVLHNSVFSNMDMHEFDNTPGPLKWEVTHGSEESLDDECCNFIASYVGALCHLMKKPGINVEALQNFVLRVLIPLMRLTQSYHRGIVDKVMDSFLDVVMETNAWGVLEETMIPYFIKSIYLTMGKLQNEEYTVYTSEDSTLTNVDSFPLLTSCHILASTLDASVKGKHVSESSSGSILANGCSVHMFTGNLLGDISNVTFQMLSHIPEHRSCAITVFLPHILKAFLLKNAFEISVRGQKFLFSRNDFFGKVWKCCKNLFLMGASERRDAYTVLSLYISYFSKSDGCEDDSVSGNGTFDLRAEKEFWDEMKKGLVDKESIVRKQSLHILKSTTTSNKEKKHSSVLETISNGTTSNPNSLTKRERWANKEARSLGIESLCNSIDSDSSSQLKWGAFFLLYEMLEEYGTHLVEAAWNYQMNLLLDTSRPSDNHSKPVNERLHLDPMETLEDMFDWLAVLWLRGLCHDNPQVRCLIMQSVFGIEWKNHGNYAKFVPRDFVLGSFIQGLNDPVHHKEFGLKGVYSSRTIDGASTFLQQYTMCLSEREQMKFLSDLATLVKNQSFGRAGLMSLAECVAAAAFGIGTHHKNEVDIDSTYYNDRAALLDVFRFIIESSKQHFNPNYRLKVCGKILDATISVMSSSDVALEPLLHFISSFPPDFVNYGGSLREKVRKWLRGYEKQDFKLVNKLNEFPGSFINHNHSENDIVTYDDEDMELWELKAKRWARALFLAIEEEHQLDSLLQFIQTHGNDLCNKSGYQKWLPVKYMILILSVVQELHEMKNKTVDNRAKRTNGLIEIVDHAGSMVIQKFTESFTFILKDLESYTKESCTVFWSKEVGDTTLPSSIKGRLGGLSQRRLSSSNTTAVLQAITSVKTLASISSYCAHFQEEESLSSTLDVLSDISWDIISHTSCNSETKAEIQLGAYEALHHILKSLVLMPSSSALSLLTKLYDFLSPEAVVKPHIGFFVQMYLDNINYLIETGYLARARRAILIEWKWLCLESLLSIPKNALQRGVPIKNCDYFFSDGVVRKIFNDLVDSLENASEGSVLPMLRSLRLVLDLFVLGCRGSTDSSCDSIDVQMMWHLVRSSWLLHVSCNKRRVAPIAALLSSVLHNSVFSNMDMHEFDNTPGPLKWFVEKILEEGTRSPRTIRLAALHLTGLWLSHPAVIKYYMKELKLLTLYGSVAFDEDFEAEVTENHDARTEVSILSTSPDPELTEVFINTELYARVSVAVMFNKLDESSHASLQSGKLFLLELIHSVVNDTDLAKELYKKYSATHRRKVRAWQMICILSQFVDQEILSEVMDCLHTALYRNNMPAVRQYLETFAISVYLKFPSLVGEELVPMVRKYDMRTQALSSYVFIAANVILHANKDTQSRHLNELLPPIVPLLTSHHHSLRGFTQLLVYQVLSKLLPVLDFGGYETMSLEKRCFVELKSFLEDNSDCARLRVSMEVHLDAFDPKKSITPAGIFSNRVDDIEFECAHVSLLERVIDFLNDVRKDLRSSMAKDATQLKNEQINVQDSESNNETTSKLQNDISLDFQKKVIVSKHEMQDSHSGSLNTNDNYNSLLDVEKEDELLDQTLRARNVAMEKLKAGRQQIILVASLLDRVPNLAGLARTCEVFKAASLVIDNANILHDKQFQLISVTAEKWVPIIEVPVSNVKGFLEKKKQEGFSILGLEQTANSFALDQYTFPKKTVLVLGREKEGIPVDLIHILDACIEIPQLGVVRSLNVHVSGAIALWEYTRQQRSS